MAQNLFKAAEEQRKENVEKIVENVKATFLTLSSEALSRNNDDFLRLARTKLENEREVSSKELESKKSLIDQQLGKMGETLDKVSQLMGTLEKDREKKFGELDRSITIMNQQTNYLRESTESLRQALSGTKIRGQWGERMAEDVLRVAGFIENINYIKQKTLDSSGTRPDFTFLMPNELTLNMDVKFPFDNYLKFIECDSEFEKKSYRDNFLKDIKLKIKEVTSRDYINPQENTVDYVLLFIPNDQIYSFIHEQDRTLLDDALLHKVILCSPVTLFAVLSIIRQTIDTFSLEKTSNEILTLLGSFKKQWDLFIKKFDVLGERISSVQTEFDNLLTTRRRKVEKLLTKIDEIREEKSLPLYCDNNEE